MRELLVTWPLRQMRGSAVPRPPDDGGDDEWSWRCEGQHGEPKLEDRELALRTALNVLTNDGKDVQAIVAALREIKGMALETLLRGVTTDLQRHDADEADVIRRNLSKWLARAVNLHHRTNPDKLPDAQLLAWNERLTAITFDEPMSDNERARRDWLFFPRPDTMTRRRAKQGNPDAKIVEAAHDILAASRVPRGHHRHLLWAIGIVDENGHLPRRNFSRD